MSRAAPRPVFLDEHGRYVFEDGTPLPTQPIDIRKALVGAFVSVALVIAIPLVIGFGAYRDITNDQIRRNVELIKTLNAERIARTQAINEFIYNQCVQAEVRDVIIVQQLEAAKRRARATLPRGSAILEDQLGVLDDGINALEPDTEQDCVPPPAVEPKGAP